MCIAGMFTMATVNIRPGAIKVPTPPPTSTAASKTTALVTTAWTTTASTTTSTVESTTTMAGLTYVSSKCPSSLICYFSEVLILSTFYATNVPVLTNAAGREDKDFDFEIDEGAEVYYSCSLTWQNEFYVFGGFSRKPRSQKLRLVDWSQLPN